MKQLREYDAEEVEHEQTQHEDRKYTGEDIDEVSNQVLQAFHMGNSPEGPEYARFPYDLHGGEAPRCCHHQEVKD